MLRFSSEEEALQYLSDTTNKTIKIAMDSYAFNTFVEYDDEYDVEVIVEYVFFEEEDQTYDYPGTPASVEIESIVRKDTKEDVTDKLSQDQIGGIKDSAFGDAMDQF